MKAIEACGLVCERLAVIPISQPFPDVAVLQRLVMGGGGKRDVKNIFSLHKHKCSLFHCCHLGVAGSCQHGWEMSRPEMFIPGVSV